MKIIYYILIIIFCSNLSALDITVLGPNEGKIIVPDSIVITDNSLDFSWTYYNTSSVDIGALTSVKSRKKENYFIPYSYTSFDIYDLSGRLVYSSKNNQVNILVHLSNLELSKNQLYFIRTLTTHGNFIDKIAILMDGNTLINNKFANISLIQILSSYNIKIYKSGYEAYNLSYKPTDGKETTITLEALFDDLYSEISIKIEGIQYGGTVEYESEGNESSDFLDGTIDLEFTTGHSDERKLDGDCINFSSPPKTESKGFVCNIELVSTDNLAYFCFANCSEKNNTHTFEINRVTVSSLKENSSQIRIYRTTGQNVVHNQTFNVDYSDYDVLLKNLDFIEDSEKFYVKITDKQQIMDTFGHSNWSIYQYSQSPMPPYEWNSYKKEFFQWQNMEVKKGAVIEVEIYKK